MISRDRLKSFWPHGLSAFSGIALAFCFERWNIGQLVWVALIPLIYALWFSEPNKQTKPRWRHGLVLGYIAGLAFFLTSQWWLWSVGKVAENWFVGLLSWLALPAYLALYFAAFGAFASTVGRWVPRDPGDGRFNMIKPSLAVLSAAFLNAAAWCGLEWLRGVMLTGFGWNGLGVALHESLMLIQIADIIGVTGLSFVILAANCIALGTAVRLFREIHERKRMRPHLDFSIGMLMIISVFLYGFKIVTTNPEKTVDIRAAIVQQNTPIEEKYVMDSETANKIAWGYKGMTDLYVENGQVDLVVWPETALPLPFFYPAMQDFLNDQVLPVADFNLITGMEERNIEDTEVTNSVALMRGNTKSYQNYRKIHLVPFGEFIPFRNSFPPFEWMFGKLIEADFTRGTSTEPLEMETLAGEKIGIAPLICFEDTLPELARKFVREGPQLLVNVTNDGWFYESDLAHQHMANSKFRCVELKRPMARAANTGVSGFIDEYGNVYDRYSNSEFLRIIRDDQTGDTFIRGSISAMLKIPANPPITFFAKHGDLFSKLMGSIALIAVVIFVLRSRRENSVTATPSQNVSDTVAE